MATYIPTSTEIVHETKVDFRRRPIVEAVHIVQYDDSMPILAVELYSDGMIYQAPSDNTFKLRFGHGDGTFSYVESIGTNLNRSIVYFRVTPAMTYRCGLRKPVVEMTAGFAFANSSEIPVMIDRNPIQESDEESYSEYSGITQALNSKVDKTAQAAKTASMTQPVGIDSDGKLWSVPGGGGGGTDDHTQLINRDAADSHPISAITGLTMQLSRFQLKILNLEEIEAGAAAGATAYQKPADGIPASDIASGVIPQTEQASEILVSTTISSSSADTEIPTAKAVYDYIQSLDGNGVQY